MQVQVELVDQHHAGRLFQHAIAEMRIQADGFLRDVSHHGQHAALTVTEIVERLGAALLRHHDHDLAALGIEIEFFGPLQAANHRTLDGCEDWSFLALLIAGPGLLRHPGHQFSRRQARSHAVQVTIQPGIVPVCIAGNA